MKLADLDHRKIPATDPNANTAKQEAERQRQMAAIAALAAKLTAPTKVNGSNK